MYYGIHTGMGAGGWVLMALLWVVVIALIAWVVTQLLPTRGYRHGGVHQAPAERPRDVLDRRLAAGEIDVETYEQLRERLDPRSLAGRG